MGVLRSSVPSRPFVQRCRSFEMLSQMGCLPIDWEPAYVTAESIDSSFPFSKEHPQSCECGLPGNQDAFDENVLLMNFTDESSLTESSTSVKKVSGHRLLRPGGKPELDPLLDSESSQIGEVLQAAAALKPSRNTQQDVWLLYRNLVDSQPAQMRQAGPHSNQSQALLQRSTRRSKKSCTVLIATQLNALQDEDPEKVLIVRKINRLGFDSATILKAYFERFGPVSKVLVCSSHEKPQGEKVRVRPAGIGYVLFDHAEDAALALAEGTPQLVDGNEIFVSPFERRRRPSSDGSSEADGSRDGVDGSSEGDDHSSACLGVEGPPGLPPPPPSLEE